MLIVEQQVQYSPIVATTPCKPRKANRKVTKQIESRKQTDTTQTRKIEVNEFLSMFAASSGSHSDGETTPKAKRTSGPKKSASMTVPRKQSVTHIVHRAASFTDGALTVKNMNGTATPPRAYATPAYADSPSANELPPPPVNWTCGPMVPKMKLVASYSLQSKPLTGLEFLNGLAK
jgi:hypothetical protein